MRNKHTLPALITETISKFPSNSALTFVNETPMTYADLGESINSIICFLEQFGIKPKDKVAILSANMPNWGASYFAIASMGAIIVPILPDFLPNEVENVLNHSEAKALFVSESLQSKLTDLKIPNLSTIITIENFSVIKSDKDNLVYDKNGSPKNSYKVEESDLATIIYTSGTTGGSKGVMLSHKNIVFNSIQCGGIQPVNDKDRFLSILPLSHTYENTLGLILPMGNGACVHYLRKPPTAPVLLPALKDVRPTIMLSVPIIIEKIYKNKILKTFTDGFVIRNLYKIGFVKKKLNGIAGKKLKQTFGGEIKFFGIGGAKLDKTVEEFLIDAKFPYAIGYGLTETSPLLAGVSPNNVRLQSTGPAALEVEIKIHNPDPVTGQGEVWARGPNIMQGYYKEPKLTKEVLDEEGWFKTGDLGEFDKDNFLFIKGRLKNMIVGQSGENIYPEEIETVINNFRHVVESVVIQQKGKLVALVHFNAEELEEKFKLLRKDMSEKFNKEDFEEKFKHLRKDMSDKFNTEELEEKYKQLKEDMREQFNAKRDELQKELHNYVNSRVNKFSQIQKIIEHPEPFIKTATLKIKRFLYNDVKA